MIRCVKCRKEIPDESLYCLHCGKKQTKTAKQRTRKRPHGTGTISRDNRHKKPWIAHAPSQNGKRVYLGSYATAKDAQLAIDDYLRTENHPRHMMTLQEIYQEWSKIHYRQISESAVRLYTSIWKHFEKIQHLSMCDIRTAHFQDIMNQTNSKSASHTMKILAGMLCKYAMEIDIIQKNYAEFLKIPAFEKTEKQIFTTEDILLLWQHADDKRVQIILFMIYMGLRIGELANLKISDIYLDKGYLICGEKTKAGKNRIVPFPANIPELEKFVKSWILESNSGNTDSLLGLTVAQIRHQYFYAALVELKLVEPAAKQHGIYIFKTAHYTPHSTRHTFASMSASAGIQPENLQKIIGHASYSTTADIYIHKNIAELKAEMNKIHKIREI